MIAASDGFPPAVRAYQDIEENNEVDFSGFSNKGLAEKFYNGDFDALSKQFFTSLEYIRGVQDFLELDPNEYDASCKKLADRKLAEEVASFAPRPLQLPSTYDRPMAHEKFQFDGAEGARCAGGEASRNR